MQTWEWRTRKNIHINWCNSTENWLDIFVCMVLLCVLSSRFGLPCANHSKKFFVVVPWRWKIHLFSISFYLLCKIFFRFNLNENISKQYIEIHKRKSVANNIIEIDFSCQWISSFFFFSFFFSSSTCTSDVISHLIWCHKHTSTEKQFL